MSQTDRPEDQTLAAPDRADRRTTPACGRFPRLQDAIAADPLRFTEPELAEAETDRPRSTGGPAARPRRDRDRASHPSLLSTPPPGSCAAISQLGTLVEQRLTGLQTLFDREIRAEATRERIVDRLHAELQEYKQDLLLKVQRPIFIDLIQLHDDIGKMIDAQPTDDPDRAAARAGTLDSIRTGIEDILYRQGVEPFRPTATTSTPAASAR